MSKKLSVQTIRNIMRQAKENTRKMLEVGDMEMIYFLRRGSQKNLQVDVKEVQVLEDLDGNQ